MARARFFLPYFMDWPMPDDKALMAVAAVSLAEL